MPQFKQYPGENPAAAKSRIAKNRAKMRRPAKNDMLSSNIASTAKNIGY